MEALLKTQDQLKLGSVKINQMLQDMDDKQVGILLKGDSRLASSYLEIYRYVSLFNPQQLFQRCSLMKFFETTVAGWNKNTYMYISSGYTLCVRDYLLSTLEKILAKQCRKLPRDSSQNLVTYPLYLLLLETPLIK